MQFILEEDDYKLVLQTDAVTTDQLLEHFVQFLRGCGYLDDSIYDSMKELLEEREDYVAKLNEEASELKQV